MKIISKNTTQVFCRKTTRVWYQVRKKKNYDDINTVNFQRVFDYIWANFFCLTKKYFTKAMQDFEKLCSLQKQFNGPKSTSFLQLNFIFIFPFFPDFFGPFFFFMQMIVIMQKNGSHKISMLFVKNCKSIPREHNFNVDFFLSSLRMHRFAYLYCASACFYYR